MCNKKIFLAVLVVPLVLLAQEKPEKPKVVTGPTVSLPVDQITDFANQPGPIQQLLRYGLELAGQQLTYKPASADPANGGMDCSGCIHHLLKKHGWNDVPRQSNDMYAWVWREHTFRAFNGLTLASFEMEELRPGDLLFWANTTSEKTDRDPPITHVMIYLGKHSKDGRLLMLGSSNGRTYEGIARQGVSVFDFKLPSAGSAARFVGYAHLPGKKKG